MQWPKPAPDGGNAWTTPNDRGKHKRRQAGARTGPESAPEPPGGLKIASAAPDTGYRAFQTAYAQWRASLTRSDLAKLENHVKNGGTVRLVLHLS